jgi:hypothetical protein
MPRTEPEFAESYQIAYEQASISLQNQATVLESYQARAATIISAAAIATSFLGGRALVRGQPGSEWTWIAVACFAGLILACGVVLWPRYGWRFDVIGEQIIDDSIENAEQPPLSPAMLRRELAIYMSRSHESNRLRLRVLVWSLQVAVVLLSFEIGAWVVTLR